MKTIMFPHTGTVGAGVLSRGAYASDVNTTALIVNGGYGLADPNTTVLTINPAGETLARGEVCIKNYGGREPVPAQLVALGVIAEPHRHIVQGFVVVPVCRLLVDDLPWLDQ